MNIQHSVEPKSHNREGVSDLSELREYHNLNLCEQTERYMQAEGLPCPNQIMRAVERRSIVPLRHTFPPVVDQDRRRKLKMNSHNLKSGRKKNQSQESEKI